MVSKSNIEAKLELHLHTCLFILYAASYMLHIWSISHLRQLIGHNAFSPMADILGSHQKMSVVLTLINLHGRFAATLSVYQNISDQTTMLCISFPLNRTIRSPYGDTALSRHH